MRPFENEVQAIGPALPLNGTFVDREFHLLPLWMSSGYSIRDRTTQKLGSNSWRTLRWPPQEAADKHGISLVDIESLLALPKDAAWTERAQEELRSARPPVSQKD